MRIKKMATENAVHSTLFIINSVTNHIVAFSLPQTRGSQLMLTSDTSQSFITKTFTRPQTEKYQK